MIRFAKDGNGRGQKRDEQKGWMDEFLRNGWLPKGRDSFGIRDD